MNYLRHRKILKLGLILQSFQILVGCINSSDLVNGAVLIDDKEPPLFEGLSTLSTGSDGKPLLVWKTATDNKTPIDMISYHVFRREEAQSLDESMLIGVEQGKTNYSDVGALKNVTYFYRVEAMDLANNSSKNGVEKELKHSKDKTAPTFAGLMGVKAQAGKAQLYWGAAEDNESKKEDLIFLIFRSEDSSYIPNDSKSALAIVTKTNTYLDSEVIPGRNYYYFVRAQDEAGNVDTNRQQVSFEVPEDREAPVFTGVQQVGSMGEKIIVSWLPAKDNSTSSDQMIYQIFRAENVSQINLTESPHGTVLKGELSFEDVMVSEGKTYHYYVRAQDLTGNTSAVLLDSSNALKTKSGSLSAGLTFAGLEKAIAISDTRVELSWSPALGSNTQVYYEIFINGDFSKAHSTTAATFIVVKDLLAATNYQFVVRAFDLEGRRGRSNVFKSVKTDDCCYPKFDGARSATVPPGIDGESQIQVSWDPATDEKQASGVSIEYKIYTRIVGGVFNFQVPSLTTTEVTRAVSQLLQSADYEILVRAQNSSGKEERNNKIVSATTRATAPINFAGIRRAYRANGTGGLRNIILEWDVGTGSYNKYAVYLRNKDTTTVMNWQSPLKTLDLTQQGSNITHITLGQTDNIQANTNYEVAVKAINTNIKLGVFPFDVDYESQNNPQAQFEIPVNTNPPRPLFAGISSLLVPAGTHGLTSLDVNWNRVGPDEVANKYIIFVRNPDGNGHCPANFNFSIKSSLKDYVDQPGCKFVVNDKDITTYQLSGLVTNSRTCVAVRTAYQDGIVDMIEDTQTIQDNGGICAIPEMTPIVGGGLVRVEVDPAQKTSKIDIEWSHPTAGLWDQVHLSIGRTTQEAEDLGNNAAKPCPAEIPTCRFSYGKTGNTKFLTGLAATATRCAYIKFAGAYGGASQESSGGSALCATTDPQGVVRLVYLTQPRGSIPGNPFNHAPVLQLQTDIGAGWIPATGAQFNNIEIELVPYQETGCMPATANPNGAQVMDGNCALGNLNATAKSLVNTSNGNVYFAPALGFIDNSPSNTRPFRLLAKATTVLNVQSVVSDIAQNAEGGCVKTGQLSYNGHTASVYTSDGGCAGIGYGGTGLVFSKQGAPRAWSSIIKQCTGTQISSFNPMGPNEADCDPSFQGNFFEDLDSRGYCRDLSENGYTDWFMPKTLELHAIGKNPAVAGDGPFHFNNINQYLSKPYGAAELGVDNIWTVDALTIDRPQATGQDWLSILVWRSESGSQRQVNSNDHRNGMTFCVRYPGANRGP